VFLGVEIGGTKLQLGLCDRQGRLQMMERRSVKRHKGAARVLAQIEESVPLLLHRARAIGVGFGGPVNRESGRVVKSHQVRGWSAFALRQWFEKKFQLPTIVENDANCAAFAEAKVGAGLGKRVVFYTNVGTGIGGGLVIDGALYNGRLGAMEIGQMILPACAGAGLPRDRSSWVGKNWETLESLASGLVIESGVRTITQSARYVGIAIANAITLLNPDIVIVGGGVALAGQKFFKPLRQTVRNLVFPLFRGNASIVPAALGEAVVVVGAALLASRRID
jgi:glucokinase